ncbi:MAG TPA: S1C family serine protease [Nitrososphaerales archaeon]|nr:S1C family serine protease [Nitrososphaerales archaeon]
MQLLQSFSNAVSELAENVSPCVVNVNSGRSSGSGMVWSGDGLVVTASHVIGHSTAPVVTFGDGTHAVARVLGRDVYTDVALLKAEVDGLLAVSPASAEGLKVGQFVLALANARGKKASATSGIVTSYGRSVRGFWGVVIEDAVVSDAKLNPGYSGGPLVDALGRVLGMNVAYFGGRGVAVPVSSLKEIVTMVLKDGKMRTGFLGIVVEPIELPQDLAMSPEVGQDEGLMVRAVEAGSPAKAAGVSIGDVILKLGDARATDEYELHRALSGDVVGRQVGLLILRSEKLTELKITPSEAEA